MTLLKTGFLDTVRDIWKRSDREQIAALVKFRDEYIDDCRHNDGMITAMYREFGRAIGRSERTVADYMSIIREYSLDQLNQWLDAGLSMAHIRSANANAEHPSLLLDAAIENGGKVGNEPMTVDEMEEFANLGKQFPPRTPAYWVKQVVTLFTRRGFWKDWEPQARAEAEKKLEEFLVELERTYKR